MIIREANLDDVDAIARVHVESWESTYRGIIPDAAIKSRSHDVRFRQWTAALTESRSDRFLLVAEDATGNIVGFVSAGEERSGDAEYRGEIYAIYLRESAQGKGIGTRLMREAAARLARHGYRAMLLWVQADNPSRRFYERLGGRPARSKQVTYGVELEEVGYGWDDLAILAVNGQTA